MHMYLYTYSFLPPSPLLSWRSGPQFPFPLPYAVGAQPTLIGPEYLFLGTNPLPEPSPPFALSPLPLVPPCSHGARVHILGAPLPCVFLVAL